MIQHSFPAGSVIFRHGDPGACAYLIHSGSVELLRDSADRLTRLAELGPGEVFGEMSLIEERPHTLTARAVSQVEASALTRDEFEGLLTSDPAACRLYLKTLFERLRAMARSATAQSATALVPLARNGTRVRVTIHPVTRRAAETLPENGLAVTKFPFRIGRAAQAHEREPLDLNDLWLLDRPPFTISRNHVLIGLDGGSVFVKDRGSYLGVYVNDVHIGGRTAREQAPLEDGDNVVALGPRTSPYQFRIHVARS